MRKAYFELHIAVLLFGFTAILGKVISLDAIPLVWWRVMLTTLSFLFVVKLRKAFREIPARRIRQYVAVGFLLAVHWISFFWAIKLSNASVALAAFSTQTFFTALVEPLIVGTPFRKYELLLGVMVIPSMLLIVHGIDFNMTAGLVVGIISALLVAIFASLNKRLITTASPLQISFFELSGAWLGISLVMPFLFAGNPEAAIPVSMEWVYLMILAFLCTTVAYVLAMRALVHLTAFASNLTINLEPIYGIVMAWLLLRENQELATGFYLGSALLIATVISYPFVRRYFNRKTSDKIG